jgi:hypothetical protein
MSLCVAPAAKSKDALIYMADPFFQHVRSHHESSEPVAH